MWNKSKGRDVVRSQSPRKTTATFGQRRRRRWRFRWQRLPGKVLSKTARSLHSFDGKLGSALSPALVLMTRIVGDHHLSTPLTVQQEKNDKVAAAGLTDDLFDCFWGKTRASRVDLLPFAVPVVHMWFCVGPAPVFQLLRAPLLDPRATRLDHRTSHRLHTSQVAWRFL